MTDENKNKDINPLYIKVDGKSLSKHDLPDANYTIATTSSDFSTRPGFSKEDFYDERPEEKLPSNKKDIIKSCQNLYKTDSLIRNIIDLMADFASEGIELQHPNRNQEQFFKAWAKNVDLSGRCHDFMRNLLRDGNVIVYRSFAKLSKAAIKQIISNASCQNTAVAADDIIRIYKESKKYNKFEIPWKYQFLSPTSVVKISSALEKFSGIDVVGLELDNKLVSIIRKPSTEKDKELVSKLPQEILDAIKKNKSGPNTVVPLDPNKTHLAYYKKDDWDEWGVPFLYGILNDVMFKSKMRQADIAALDGIINTIRIWKLGKSDKDILPTRTAVNKLLSILENNVGGGVMDLVWDDMIDLTVEYPPVDKILGDAKYKSVNNDIVRGLGIPDALIGGSDATTRNSQTAFVQLKTLMQRLEYVRSICLDWLVPEIEHVSKAMGFRKPPLVSFGNMSLRDESSEKKLLIQLLDRGVISIETVLANFGRDFMVELERLRDEENIRKVAEPLIEKANPFYRPKSLVELQGEQQIKLATVKSDSGGDNPNGDQPRQDMIEKPNGRPPGTTDTEPRKRREVRIMNSVDCSTNLIKANNIMDYIDDVFDPKNKRILSSKDREDLENVKWKVMCCLDTSFVPSKENLNKIIDNPDMQRISKICSIYDGLLSNILSSTKNTLTKAEKRTLMAMSWALFYSNK